jgi:hypothetical protein
MKIERSLPYFNAIIKSPNSNRMQILKAFPSFVVDDLVNIIFDIVSGRLDIGSRKENLKKHRNVLMAIANTKSMRDRRRVLKSQTGGFIAAILPIVLGALGLANFWK